MRDYSFIRRALIYLAVAAVSVLVMVRPAAAEGTLSAQDVGGVTSCYFYGWSAWAYTGPAAMDCAQAGMEAYWPASSIEVFSIDFGFTTPRVYYSQDGGPTLYREVHFNYSGSCPANSSGTVPASCVCDEGYAPDESGGACVMPPEPCPDSGVVQSSGFYDVGTSPMASALIAACTGSCAVTYSGDGVSARSVVSGEYHYYVKGLYTYNGVDEHCSEGDNVPAASGAAPESSCPSGQTLVRNFQGSLVCRDVLSGQDTSANSAQAVADAEAALASSQAADIASRMDAAESAVVASGGDAAAVAQARAVAAGVNKGGSVTFSGASVGSDPVLLAFCTENPAAAICAEQDFGSVDDVTLSDKTIDVSITPVAVGGAGSCPAPSSMILHGQEYFFVWDTYCNFATGIKPILLAFAWLSAAGLLVGGFRSA